MSKRHAAVSQLSRDQLAETLDVLRAFLDDAIVNGETTAANAFLTAACRIARHIDKRHGGLSPLHDANSESDSNANFTAPTRAAYARMMSKLQKP